MNPLLLLLLRQRPWPATAARAHARVRATLAALATLLGLLAPAAQAATYSAEASATTAAAYPWIDISSSGTTLSLGDDAVASNVPIGFSFSFGGTAYTSLAVMSNGMLQFGSTNTAFQNSSLPLNGNNGEPNINAVMVPLWDDLAPSSGQVRYQTQGSAPNRVFIVAWNAVPYYGNSNLKATFQVQLYEQGHFVFRYGAVNGSGGTHTSTNNLSNPSGATVGWELSDSDYVQYSRNSAAVPSGTTIVWTQPPVTPIAQYLFNEPSWAGSTAEVTDSAGAGLHGTAAGLASTKPSTASVSPAAGGATGTCGYGVFNRSNKDYVALPAGIGNLGSSGSFTVTAWIRSTDAAQVGQRIIADDENNSGGYTLSLGDGGTGMLRFVSRGTGSSISMDTASVISSNTWYFVAASVNTASKTKSVYVYNSAGTQLAAISATYTESSFGSDAGITTIGGESNAAAGNENNSNYGFAGNLDEVRIYSAALTGSQINQVRALTSTCPNATRVAQYHFEDSSWAGSNGEWTDSAGYSGGPFNGQAQGSALPTSAATSPALAGSPGSCGYANLPGPVNGGGGFIASGLPLSAAAGAQTSIAFWMYWNGSDNMIVASFNSYDLWFNSGHFGFNTNTSDIYGISSSGLANGWHHVVAVFTNGSVSAGQLYIDGVAKTLTQRMGSPNLGNAIVASTLRMGGYGPSTGFRFIGRLDEVEVYKGALSAAQVATLYAQTHACPVAVHHVEIRVNASSGLTCAPTTLTVAACQDAACTTPYTGGISGTLTASGSGMSVSWPSGANFSIASGSSSSTVDMQLTTAGSVLLGSSGLSPSTAGSTTCNFGSPSCTFTAAASGFLFDVPDHAAESPQTVSITAVAKATNSSACTASFASTSKTVSFKCSYANPASGTLPVRVGGTALNSANNSAAACDGSGRSLSLAFNASGVASTTLSYADVGRLQLSATYVGSGADAGLTMSGSDSFTVAPYDFSVGAIPGSAIAAGSPFPASVSARNAAGNATPNFGHEAVPEGATLGFVRTQPSGSGAASGSFSGSLGSFSGGVATASNLAYTEVGQGQVSAVLTSGSYLGSGLSAAGTSAAASFKPHHFDLAATPACGSFSYAGQPFAVTLSARNAANAITLNYDGSANTSPNFAKATTLAEAAALGLGSLSGSSVAATAFAGGVASASPAYGFSAKATAPQSLVLRASDSDGVSSAGYAEPTVPLRSGRLRLSNAYGSAAAALQVPVVVEYWGGSSWLLNSEDNCSAVGPGSVALSNLRNAAGGTATASSSANAVSLSNGSGSLRLNAPTPAGSSLSLDIAINLGSSGADQSCQASHPASTGAAQPWLRAQNGACSASADRDPAARASFGVFSPETRKTVHVREIF